MRTIYYLGGSPCSGKSTVARMLADKYGFVYFCLDDHLDEYTERGAKQNKPHLVKYVKSSADEVWLADPKEQNDEEIAMYEEMFPLAVSDLMRIRGKEPIIAEGAGFMPKLMKASGVKEDNYVCIVPTKAFQYEKYSERNFIKYVLAKCTNPEKGFENWMERDALFARSAVDQAAEAGYQSILIDGRRTQEDILAQVEELFGLSKQE
jgi:2-phosphoglycerate kinase